MKFLTGSALLLTQSLLRRCWQWVLILWSYATKSHAWIFQTVQRHAVLLCSGFNDTILIPQLRLYITSAIQSSFFMYFWCLLISLSALKLLVEWQEGQAWPIGYGCLGDLWGAWHNLESSSSLSGHTDSRGRLWQPTVTMTKTLDHSAVILKVWCHRSAVFMTDADGQAVEWCPEIGRLNKYQK